MGMACVRTAVLLAASLLFVGACGSGDSGGAGGGDAIRKVTIAPATAPAAQSRPAPDPADAAPPEPAWTDPRLPRAKDLAALVTRSLLAFDNASKRRDFTDFHKTVSRPLAEKLGPADMLAAFAPYIEKNVDLAGIAAMTPVLNPPPAIDPRGLLVTSGYYPTSPARVLFTLKYLRESTEWRLIAIDVHVQPIPLPSEAEARALAARTMTAFATAVRENNFAPLVAAASADFRAEYAPAQVAAAFKDFVERKVDLSALASTPPAFDGPPRFEGRMMVLSGRYPLAGFDAVFTLKYLPEAEGWRLVKLAVETAKPATTRPATRTAG